MKLCKEGVIMFPDKIKITDDLIKLIIDTRKEYNLTAYQLSEKIGKNKSWLPNIENKRTKNISKEDLITLFKDFAKDKNMDAEEFVIKYLSPTANVELDDNVSVPNYYLQSTMSIHSPDHENLHISDEERMKRVAYYVSEKPYEVDLMRLKKNLKDFSDLIIDEFSYCESSQNREDIIKMIKTMRTNFAGEFAHTQKLYSFPLFHGESTMGFGKEVGTDFLQKTDTNIERFLASQDLISAYADICSDINFEKDRYNLFTDIMLITEKTSTEKLEFIFSGLEAFIYKLHIYLLAAQKKAEINKSPCKINFIPLFEHIFKSLNIFINNANLDYHFEYTIPEQTASINILIDKCHEFDQITTEIEQAMLKRTTV